MTTTYQLSEPQATAVIAAVRLLKPEQVEELLPDTQSELFNAYHRLRGELTRSLYVQG